MKKRKRFFIFISAFYYCISISGALENNVTNNVMPLSTNETSANLNSVKKELNNATTKVVTASNNSPTISTTEPPSLVGSGNKSSSSAPNVQSYKKKSNHDHHHVKKEERSKHHLPSMGGTKKRESEAVRPSILGSMFLYLITVLVAGTLFVMLVCFAHKWNETMGIRQVIE